jgi:hypothetical protein
MDHLASCIIRVCDFFDVNRLKKRFDKRLEGNITRIVEDPLLLDMSQETCDAM